MLMFYADMIEKLGLNFYYNERRKDSKRAIEKYLEQEKAVIIDDFSKYIDNTYECAKVFNGKKILFSEYLVKNNLYASLDIMIMTMVKNGLTDKDFIQLITGHIDRFIELFINATIVWESLENVKTEV